MVATRALHAAEEGDLSVLQSLDESILNETTVDEAGSNCLHYAARQGGVEVMAFLVSQKGFKGNVRSDVGATPAHDAAAAGNLQTLQWLLKNTACSVSDQDGIGATVLHLACRFHHTHVTEWLLEHESCDVSKGTASGGIPLHFAVVGRDYEAVKMLVSEDPMTVNLQTSNGATAVYLAGQEGAIDILQTLIQDHRGNIKIKSYDGMSCLHAAAQSGHLSCVQFLIEEEKFNPNERDFDGATPLHYAASQGHAHVIDWLLKVGGARVTLDNLGGSALHNAAEMDCMECARTLINNGCDVTITDNNGLTASELARKCYHDDCALLIETHTAQSQTPVEPDVEYLLSAQSPRINLLRPYVTQYDGRQPPNTPSFLTKEPKNSSTETGNQAYLNGYQPTSGPPTFTYNDNRGINQSEKEPTLKLKTKSVESIIAEADPEEFPVGVPRRVSQDFSVGSQSKQFENSPLSSSLSSLSQLDEVLEKASKEIEDSEQSRRISAQGGRVNKPRFLSEKPGTGLNVKPYGNGSQFVNPDSTRNRNSQFAGRFSYLGAKVSEPKSVSFKTPSANNSYETVWLDDKTGRHNMESKGVHIDVEGQENGDGMIDDIERLDLNGTNDMDGANQGSVDDLDIISTNGYGRDHPMDNYHHPINSSSEARSVLKMENGAHADSNEQPLVNGNVSPTNLHVGDFPTPPANPPQTNNQSQNFNSNLSMLQNEGSKSIIPNSMNGRDSNQGDSNHVTEKLTNGTTLFSVYEAENQLSLQAPPPPLVQGLSPPVQATPPLVQAPPPPEQSPPISVLAPPPPPPPPPPPVPTANTQPELDDGIRGNPEALSPGLREEAKKKSVSLPARPTSILTAEMMQSKRRTLTPAPAKNSINSSGGGAKSDFISELKMATKGPALRKTSNAGGKPTMIFSSTSKESTSADDKNKDVKVELVGEWDPKHFVDQVPNKDSLPAWKVQLQAKMIAEKTMKETLEKRAVEERESRFKNMPAWKRALVEKKEAEAKAAEEIRLQEEQKVKVSTKKPLNVNITPKAKDGNGMLAPWQLELQQKD